MGCVRSLKLVQLGVSVQFYGLASTHARQIFELGRMKLKRSMFLSKIQTSWVIGL
jgi:hypothetical protein